MIQNASSNQEQDSGILVERPHQALPMNAGMVPLILFLASLTMLFVALMVGYVFVRIKQGSPPFGELKMPSALWASTIILVASSVCAHAALRAVKAEQQTRFRQALILTLMMAGAFVLIQFPCLWKLLQLHEQITSQETRYYFYGLVFFMIVVHALHVIGGIIPMAVVTAKAHRGVYDHENYGPVLYTVTYWHFLDIVWIVMFLTMFAIS